jgi:hypothetical protein
MIPKILYGKTSNTFKPSSGIKKEKRIDTLPKTKATGIPSISNNNTTTNIDNASI